MLIALLCCSEALAGEHPPITNPAPGAAFAASDRHRSAPRRPHLGVFPVPKAVRKIGRSRPRIFARASRRYSTVTPRWAPRRRADASGHHRLAANVGVPVA